jgi:hypothetical protein
MDPRLGSRAASPYYCCSAPSGREAPAQAHATRCYLGALASQTRRADADPRLPFGGTFHPPPVCTPRTPCTRRGLMRPWGGRSAGALSRRMRLSA